MVAVCRYPALIVHALSRLSRYICQSLQQQPARQMSSFAAADETVTYIHNPDLPIYHTTFMGCSGDLALSSDDLNIADSPLRKWNDSWQLRYALHVASGGVEQMLIFHINNIVLALADFDQKLGVTVDDYLKFDAHTIVRRALLSLLKARLILWCFFLS